MGRTWKPLTAGILSIIGGIVGIVAGSFALLGAIYVAGFLMLSPDLIQWVAGIGGGLLALGIIAIIGGVFALRRRSWGLALAGAICALFPMFPLGVLAIIFVALGKKDFFAKEQAIVEAQEARKLEAKEQSPE